MKLISLSLFLLSLLILQFKIVFTAEPKTHNETEGKKTLTKTSENSDSSCNLGDTATSSDASTEKEEEQQTETVTAKNAFELYHTLKLKYTKETFEIPHFGPYADVMNIFHKIILNTPLPEYIRSIPIPLYKPLGEDLKKTMSSYKKPIIKHINVLKKLIEAELPETNPEHEQTMEKQYAKLETLYWSYENEKMVDEADEAFKEMQWICPLPEKTNIMNADLYHKINNVMINLKSNVLELEKELKKLEEFQKCYAVTVQHALLRPLCMVAPSYRMEHFQELESELKLFKSHCQQASKKKSGQLPENNNLSSLMTVVKKMVQQLDVHINVYVKPVLSLLNKEESKGHDMVVNLLSTFFHFLKDENAKKRDFLRRPEHAKYNTKAAIDTLMNDEIFLNKINTCSLDNLLKFTGISIEYKDLNYFSDNLKRVSKYYLKMLPLLKLKADLLFLLHHINKSVVTEHSFEIAETTSIAPDTKSVKRINKSKQIFLLEVLNETLAYVSSVYNMTRLEHDMWSFTSEGLHMQRLTRELQYMMGTACLVCKELYETPGQIADVAKYEESLKKVHLFFWSARNAIKKYAYLL